MNSRIMKHLLALSLLATPALAGVPAPSTEARALSTGEAAALRSIEDPTLLALRAGAVSNAAALGAEERSGLREAEARTPDLGDLRAGHLEFTDRELTIGAIVLAVVLILILI